MRLSGETRHQKQLKMHCGAQIVEILSPDSELVQIALISE